MCEVVDKLDRHAALAVACRGLVQHSTGQPAAYHGRSPGGSRAASACLAVLSSSQHVHQTSGPAPGSQALPGRPFVPLSCGAPAATVPGCTAAPELGALLSRTGSCGLLAVPGAPWPELLALPAAVAPGAGAAPGLAQGGVSPAGRGNVCVRSSARQAMRCVGHVRHHCAPAWSH